MKRIFRTVLIALAAAAASACSMYDDTEIRDRLDGIDDKIASLEETVKGINSDIDALRQIVNALQQNVTIDRVEAGTDGYVIYFSDGTTAVITNGKDGANAPVISVAKDETDGLWYWTIDGEWLVVDGQRIRAQGIDGEDGKPGEDAIAPQVRINPDTRMWEISVDGGLTWESTGVIAEGQDGTGGSGIIVDVDYTSDAYNVIFTLADGMQISVPKTISVEFDIEGLSPDGVESIAYGKSKTYNVRISGMLNYIVNKPDGWRVSLSMAEDTTLTVTAPAKDNAYAETEGIVGIQLQSVTGEMSMVTVQVKALEYELRVLTFEGEYWSALIDNPQYGGPLLYGETGMGPADYMWYDEGNTFLKHVMPENYGTTCYWGGGHAISNYVETDLANGDYLHQLAVYCKDPVTGFGGHGGSENFCVHFGYKDGSPFNMTENLPAIEFGDGVARVVDHLYIMWNTYLANCVSNGNGLTAPLAPDGYVKVIAIGYDAEGVKIEQEPEYFLAGSNGNIQEWTKWDLSSLGKVSKIEFNVAGDSDNGYGFSQPAYFCYDDVAVRFE